MAKQCEACQKPFPDHLDYCPHCGTWAKPAGPKPATGEPEPPRDSEEWFKWMESRHGDLPAEKASSAEFTLSPPEGEGVGAGAHGAVNVPDELVEVEPATPAEHPWMKDRPEHGPVSSVEFTLPPAGSGPASEVKPRADLVEVTPQPPGAPPAPAGAAGAVSSEELDLMALLAEEEGGSAAGTPRPGQSPTGSGTRGKATQLAGGTKPATQLAKPDDPAASPSGSKITKIATGASPATQLAKPDDPAAGPGGSKITQIAAGSSPATQLAKPEELEISQEPPSRITETSSSAEFELAEAPATEPAPSPPADELEEVDVSEVAAPNVVTGHEDRAGATSAVGLDEDARRQLVETDESSAVDLGSTPNVNLPASELGGVHSSGRRRLDLSALAEEPSAEEEVAEAEPEVEAEEPTVPIPAARPVKAPGRAVSWVGGGVIGALIGGAACIGLGMAGLLPESLRPSSPPKQPAPVQVNRKVDQPPPPSAHVARESAGTYLDRGDFDKVLKDETPPPEGKQAEHLAARGEARWLAYLQNLKGPGHVDAKNSEVVKAEEDLSKAKDIPAALFWLGQIQERSGKLAQARETYQEGLKRFDKQPDGQLFQAALDRLESMPEGNPPAENKPAAKPADKTGARLSLPGRSGPLVLVALQAEQPADKAAPEAPKEGQPAAASPEAGSFFWKAVKLAKSRDYDKAIDQLRKARAAHEDRRFQRLRRSQNPITDPTEEIFLRACDELEAYWTMRKNPSPPPSISEGLQVVIDRLKKDKDVAKTDPEVKDVGKDLDLVLKTKEEKAAQLAALNAVLAEAKIISDTQTDVRKGLDDLVKAKTTADEALAAAGKLLEPEKYVSPQEPSVAKGVERLLAAKKDVDTKLQTATTSLKAADDTLQAVATRLAAARAAAPDARGEALVKGIDKLAQGAGGGSPVVAALANVTADLSQVGAAVGGQLAAASERTVRQAGGEVQGFLEKLRPLVSTVPGFKLPTMLQPSDPLGAERSFANGLVNFWAGQYAAAEGDFAAAVRAAGSAAPDARYYYYLGLARSAQGKRAEALEAFRQGSRLERESKPPTAVVNNSLERIQGFSRRLLDAYRP